MKLRSPTLVIGILLANLSLAQSRPESFPASRPAMAEPTLPAAVVIDAETRQPITSFWTARRGAFTQYLPASRVESNNPSGRVSWPDDASDPLPSELRSKSFVVGALGYAPSVVWVNREAGPPEVTVLLRRGATVRGTVTQAPGRAGGTRVTLIHDVGVPAFNAVSKIVPHFRCSQAPPLELSTSYPWEDSLLRAWVTDGEWCIRDVPVGSFRVAIEHEGCAPGVSAPFTVKEDSEEIRVAPVVLSAGGSLTVRLRPDTRPAATPRGITIFGLDLRGYFLRTLPESSPGTFYCDRLWPGRYRVLSYPITGPPTLDSVETREVSVRAGATTVVDF
jgi:hypothetical protein